MKNSETIAYLKIDSSYYFVHGNKDNIENTLKAIDETGIPSNGFIYIHIFKVDQLNTVVKNALGFHPLQQINNELKFRRHLDHKNIYLSNHTPS